MSRKWTIRLAAVLAMLTLSAAPAWSQFRTGFIPVVPIYPGAYPYGGYGAGMYGGYGNYGGYGAGMYGGYGNYGGYGAAYGTMGTSGYSTYYSSGTTVLAPGWGAGSNDAGRVRSTLTPATAVAADSPLLLAGWNEPTGDSRAVVVIVLPDASARITVQGMATAQSGAIRRFTTPPLDANKAFVYDIRAQWTDANGRSQDQTQTVQVRAAGVVNVIFTKKAGS